MKIEHQYLSCNCDNCGVEFKESVEGCPFFIDEKELIDAMYDDGWFTGEVDGEYRGKHYCDACILDDTGDKIILDTTRTKKDTVWDAELSLQEQEWSLPTMVIAITVMTK